MDKKIHCLKTFFRVTPKILMKFLLLFNMVFRVFKDEQGRGKPVFECGIVS